MGAWGASRDIGIVIFKTMRDRLRKKKTICMAQDVKGVFYRFRCRYKYVPTYPITKERKKKHSKDFFNVRNRKMFYYAARPKSLKQARSR